MTMRFFFTTFVVAPGIFLIVLGMRNPALDQCHGPKQRPRAVIQNVFKSPGVKCCQSHIDIALYETVAVAAVPALPEAVRLLADSEAPLRSLAPLTSRAPPSPLSSPC